MQCPPHPIPDLHTTTNAGADPNPIASLLANPNALPQSMRARTLAMMPPLDA